MKDEALAVRLAVALYRRGLYTTYDWNELLAAMQDQPADELLRMGEQELLDHVERLMFEHKARKGGLHFAVAEGVL